MIDVGEERLALMGMSDMELCMEHERAEAMLAEWGKEQGRLWKLACLQPFLFFAALMEATTAGTLLSAQGQAALILAVSASVLLCGMAARLWKASDETDKYEAVMKIAESERGRRRAVAMFDA